MSQTNHSQGCRCCTGVSAATPQAIANRPGLPALFYRAGTYTGFLETMQARLSSRDYPALAGLKTRAPDDPTMALLDAWATVADVLTFYNERLVNEGYLRTATQRRSVLELARLTGYQVRPGVAASVYLAYTLDNNAKQETLIPKGTRAQSIPGPGELPQSFETSEDLRARLDWNSLKPRLTRPQKILLDNILYQDRLYVDGVAANLKVNDHLLFVFGQYANQKVIRRVREAVPVVDANKTEIRLQSIFTDVDKPAAVEYIVRWLQETSTSIAQNADATYFNNTYDAYRAKNLLDNFYSSFLLGLQRSYADLQNTVFYGLLYASPGKEGEGTDDEKLKDFISAALKELAKNVALLMQQTLSITDIRKLLDPLLQEPSLQPRNSLQLNRSVSDIFTKTETATLRRQADAAAQLVVNFAPKLGDSFYRAWANANVQKTDIPPDQGNNGDSGDGDGGSYSGSNLSTDGSFNNASNSTGNNAAQSQPPVLQGVYVLRLTAPLFGYNAPARTGLKANPDKETQPQFPYITGNLPGDWPLDGQESKTKNQLFLDNTYDGVLAGGYALIDTNDPAEAAPRRSLQTITSVHSGPRSAYGLSGKTTQLTFDTDWRYTNDQNITLLRNTLVRAQSEALAIVEAPVEDVIGATDSEAGKRAELAGLYPELQAGRWLIISGERSDILGTNGVVASELVMLAKVEQGFDNDIPGDKTVSLLTFANSLAYSYKRSTVKIYGNVVKATHGETRSEVLGSGNTATPLQTFTLKQPPLTYVSTPNPSGIDSTLQVYVNDIQWHETDSLAGENATARKFITKTDDEGKTSIFFGNGKEGARLPTGVENIKALYRNGIGKPGNVGAGQISLLMARPLGVKEVINPLPASGGADKETRDQARRNAPLAVKALDRLVSVQDYEDFARIFAGIGKARATELSDGRHRLVHITIAGAADIPIDTTSDVFRNLQQALLNSGDPFQPIQLAVRELLFIVISANIRILPDYLWEPVVTRVRATLLDRFSFEQRELGQDFLLGEVIATIQSVPGVAYVDVDFLRGVPEKILLDNKRQLISPDDISALLTQPLWQTDNGTTTVQPNTCSTPVSEPLARVSVNLAALEGGVIRPAQLAFLTPDVESTLLLNQIL